MSKEKWVAIEDTINLIDDHIEIRNCSAEYVCKKLNEQDQKIKELEHRLSNCIVKPKFKVRDTIFVIVDDNIEEYFVDEILLRNRGTLWAYYDICKKTEITEKNELFATEEEAKARLEELQKC